MNSFKELFNNMNIDKNGLLMVTAYSIIFYMSDP